MHGIAMPHAGVIKAAAVVVDSHGAIGDLVATVAIDISHAQVVVALSGIAVPFGRVGVENPADRECAAVEIVGGDTRTGVVATTENGAKVLAVEVVQTGGWL